VKPPWHSKPNHDVHHVVHPRCPESATETPREPCTSSRVEMAAGGWTGRRPNPSLKRQVPPGANSMTSKAMVAAVKGFGFDGHQKKKKGNCLPRQRSRLPYGIFLSVVVDVITVAGASQVMQSYDLYDGRCAGRDTQVPAAPRPVRDNAHSPHCGTTANAAASAVTVLQGRWRLRY
jgi:hypothetical protein